MNVADVNVDIYKYGTCNYIGLVVADYHIQTQYINDKSYFIVVRRLDSDTGWEDPFEVMVEYTATNKTAIVHIDISLTSDVYKQIDLTDITIKESATPIHMYARYKMIPSPEPQKISREDFNKRFSANIVTLPRHLYAAGLDNDALYMYNDYFEDYWDSLMLIQHIISVALTFTERRCFYFIVCVSDGYIEGNYASDRTIPHIVQDMEYVGKPSITIGNPHEFPLFHSRKYVLANVVQQGIPFTIPIPDRHYFFCNYYNAFRSFHRGISFSKKQNKIIYAGRRDRGTKYNFLKRRDIDMNQRNYLYSDAVPKGNIICLNEWINDYEMVNYKYLLDIDGYASTWDGTAWKLNSGSVIIKSNSAWKQWFYDEYLPWVHYVPVEDDFSDIQEKFQWCEANQDKCETIIKNAKALFQKAYRFHNVIEYTKSVIDRI